MIMRHKILFIAALVCSLSVRSQTMAGLFTAMPDSMTYYLDSGQRQDLAGQVGVGGVKPFVVNSLGDTTRIDTLTGDFIEVRCNNARTIQIKRLPYHGADSIICVVNTFYGPAAESTVAFYDLGWNKLDGSFYEPVNPRELVQKPDSVSNDDFEQLFDMLDPQLVYMRLSPSDDSLTVGLSMPLVFEEKKGEIEGMLLQRKFKWNNGKFN